MTGSLPEQGLRLNPDVAHPPFPWQVQLPHDDGWTVLDTHPASWQRSAERLVDERLAGQRVKAAQRREIVHAVADLVAMCQQAGALLSLVRIAPLPDQPISTVGLHLAWYDSTPDEASLAMVRAAISRQGVVKEHETEAGTVLLQRDYASATPPGRETRVGLTSLQAFLPVPGRCWTAVVATATPHADLVEPLHELVLDVAGSIRPLDEQPVPDQEGPAPDDGSDYRAVPRTDAPGIQRGFGTLVTHQIRPNGSARS